MECVSDSVVITVDNKILPFFNQVHLVNGFVFSLQNSFFVTVPFYIVYLLYARSISSILLLTWCGVILQLENDSYCKCQLLTLRSKRDGSVENVGYNFKFFPSIVRSWFRHKFAIAYWCAHFLFYNLYALLIKAKSSFFEILA